MLTDAFDSATLTAAINRFPVQWGRINQMGLFADEGVRTREIHIEERAGTLAVLDAHEWGGNGTVAAPETRLVRALHIPQTVHNDKVLPDDIQDIRAFGSDSALESAQGVVARRLQRMRAKHDITLEWRRMGALKGVVANASGSTIVDLFSAFNVTPVSIDFELGTATSDIRAKCEQVVDQIADNLGDDAMTGVRALVSPDFWRRLVTHANVEKFFVNWQNASVLASGETRRGFTFGGVTFEEYRANIGGQAFLAAGEGHAFPEGTMDTFATYYAPADFNETVNTIGQPFYAKVRQVEFERGYELHTQSNSLPICKRPAVLVRLFSSN
ncbi:major capsid protein [Oceanicella actignis]|uniref:major capsid protein n=1 Tax=Oceanicella actignis TaxID=1189325 RepID=UPI0011E84B9A|nr:major capsid protein [Oceanicella actignis]TYO91434.1 major capsid protein E [Oceanicella actignis]